MGVQGDLNTLELADLLQNIELHRKSGCLAVETESASAKLYFDRVAWRLSFRRSKAGPSSLRTASSTMNPP